MNFFYKILHNEQHICSVTIFYFNIYVIPAGSVVEYRDYLSRGSGTNRISGWMKGDILQIKLN